MSELQLAGSESIRPGQGFLQHVSQLSRFAILIVLLIFVALAVCYSLIVPLTQGEDELAHYRYLSFIAQTGRLPANYAERELAGSRQWPGD